MDPKALFLVLAALSLAATTQIATTPADFVQPGTQPGTLSDPIETSQVCSSCHAYYDVDDEPYTRWAGSMMANSTRDPIFHAGLAIANQDMAGAGELCIRCHAPGGWLAGNGTPADGSALAGQDYEGVNCNFCHRLVDPYYAAENPVEDRGILGALASPPNGADNAKYVVDPLDRRRGPFDLGPFFVWHDWRQSPYHRESLLCATCHDVSNPAYTRSGGATPAASDTYVLNGLGLEHPTHEKTDEFPIERTFTEWELSSFAIAPIDLGGRFGGNDPLVSSCQDCHMPTTDGKACAPGFGGEQRSDLPQHDFSGANSWVPEAIWRLDQSLVLYGASEASGEPLSTFQHAQQRNIDMLQRACDLDLSVAGRTLTVRVTNQTGHKLPTGYGEGRRMWLNVVFRSLSGGVIAERGAYDDAGAELTTGDTRVWEILHGVDSAVAMATGLTAGPTFHFILNNTIELDNRIPPRGFDNAAFEAGQAMPVGTSYANGQYWNDTDFAIPAGTAEIEVTVYHQTTTKEYIEFLRDENTTNDAGQIAYDEWVTGGRSTPIAMASESLKLRGNVSARGGGHPLPDGDTLLATHAAPRRFAGARWFLVAFAGDTPPRAGAPFLVLASGRLDPAGSAEARIALAGELGRLARRHELSYAFAYRAPRSTGPSSGAFLWSTPHALAAEPGAPEF